MTDHSATFEITVESPIGKRAITEFQHYLNKIASEARERWGIKITIERVDEP
jgi:hypothetical protein